ncbi:MAG TPA: beta-propeller domain-containing protein [Actinomycetota bacterium]
MRALRALAAMGILLASCTSGPVTGLGGIPQLLAGGLQPFDDCEDFLSYVKGHGLEHVTAWGLGGGWGPVFFDAEVAAEGEFRAAQPTAGVDYSTTNIQTSGVDEPDIVKTDGERLLALVRGRLFVFDVSGSAPRKVGSLRLGDVWMRDMVLHGDRALLLGEGWGGGPGPEPLRRDVVSHGGSISLLMEVDLTDPSDPEIVRRLYLDGRYLSARIADGIVRVVVSSFPVGLEFEFPGERGGLQAKREALEHNRGVIRASTVEDWVPHHVLEDGDGTVLAEGPLLDCASAHHPTEFAGFDMLTVLTLDLEEGLSASATEGSVGVLSAGETVYASPESLYVATQRWIDPIAFERGMPADLREDFTTQIHRFDISEDEPATYRSSGRVPGWLLNQFSMDEHEGRLRVASTDSPEFWATQKAESVVTVLEERAGALVPVGSVGGLGEGERIYAVRFMGDVGYVVTFRQVDPLYVVDLSDPATPAVTGELKIPGYSAYLHPVGEGRLLGVGQDATEGGLTRGTQLSLFDVSDPADPRRIDTVKIADGSSEAEWDHHAFLYWEPEGLVVVPITTWGDELGGGGFSGAVAVRLQGDGLWKAGTLSHGDGAVGEWLPGGIRRSLVVGDLLYTVSETGLEASDLQTLDDVAWIPFR